MRRDATVLLVAGLAMSLVGMVGHYSWIAAEVLIVVVLVVAAAGFLGGSFRPR